MGLSRAFLPLPFEQNGCRPPSSCCSPLFGAPLLDVHPDDRRRRKDPREMPQENARRTSPGSSRPHSRRRFPGGRGDRTGGGGQPVDRQHRSDRRFRRGKGVAPLCFPDVRRERFGTVRPGEDLPGGDFDRGKKGWFTYNILWRVRGALDKVAGGYGGSVGRRRGRTCGWATSSTSGRWSTSGGKRLLLKARMKVAGEAWLEFRIEGTRSFRPRTITRKG